MNRKLFLNMYIKQIIKNRIIFSFFYFFFFIFFIFLYKYSEHQQLVSIPTPLCSKYLVFQEFLQKNPFLIPECQQKIKKMMIAMKVLNL